MSFGANNDAFCSNLGHSQEAIHYRTSCDLRHHKISRPKLPELLFSSELGGFPGCHQSKRAFNPTTQHPTVRSTIVLPQETFQIEAHIDLAPKFWYVQHRKWS